MDDVEWRGDYPSWSYFPRNVAPPAWAEELVGLVGSAEPLISSVPSLDGDGSKITSDSVLAALRPALEGLGYDVEKGKGVGQRISRPVLFGDQGKPTVNYEIDAFHDEHGIGVEIEAGRGAMSNAEYRDIVRTSLILDAHYFALLMPITYRYNSGGKQLSVSAFSKTREQLSAIYASERLRLPFAGVLLIGY